RLCAPRCESVPLWTHNSPVTISADHAPSDWNTIYQLADRSFALSQSAEAQARPRTTMASGRARFQARETVAASTASRIIKPLRLDQRWLRKNSFHVGRHHAGDVHSNVIARVDGRDGQTPRIGVAPRQVRGARR